MSAQSQIHNDTTSMRHTPKFFEDMHVISHDNYLCIQMTDNITITGNIMISSKNDQILTVIS